MRASFEASGIATKGLGVDTARGDVDLDLAGPETGALDLTGQQVAVGDEGLLVLGVAVEPDQIHPVE